MFWTSKLISHVTQFSPFVPESPRRLSNYMSSLSSCEAARQLISEAVRGQNMTSSDNSPHPPSPSPAVSVNHKLWCPDSSAQLCQQLCSCTPACFRYRKSLHHTPHTHTHTHTYIYFYHRLALHVINFKGQRLWQGNLFTVAEGLRFKMRSRCSSQTDGRHGLFSEVQCPRCGNKRLWISSGGTKWPRKMSEVGLWWTESVLRLSKYPLPG